MVEVITFENWAIDLKTWPQLIISEEKPKLWRVFMTGALLRVDLLFILFIL